MILITGAAGKTGQAIIKALANVGSEVRGLVYKNHHIDPVKDRGAKEVYVGDMGDPTVLQKAMSGVKSVYHICPNVSPHELKFGRLAIDVASKVSIDHFVYHSVLHPQTQKMPHHWLKLHVEEILLESGIPFTILQPAAYMQNIIGQLESITVDGIYQVPYPAETRLSMVDLEDVAEAAAIVLTQAGHEGAIYELAGPDILTQLEVGRILSQRLGRDIRVEQVSIDEWEKGARSRGMSDYQVRSLTQMFQYYERYGFWGNAQVLSNLLRRKPITFDGFIQKLIEANQKR